MHTLDSVEKSEDWGALSTGLWRIQGDRVVAVDRDWPGRLTALAPSEVVRLQALDLPPSGWTRRVQAAPFALEPILAQPLDQLHVAVAPLPHGDAVLAGVVERSLMDRWVEALAIEGLDQAVLLPDALVLAIPPAGSWRVLVQEGRALVRTPDGAGFAASEDALPALWAAGLRPALIVTGLRNDKLYDSVERVSEAWDHYSSAPLLRPPLDLRQGIYASRTAGRSLWTSTKWAPTAWAAAMGLMALCLIGLADTVALDVIADRREAETRRLLAERAPALAQQADLGTLVQGLAARQGGSAFVTTLARAAAVVPAGQGEIKSLTYRPGQVRLVPRDADPIGASQVLAQSVRQAGGAARVDTTETSGGPAVVVDLGRVR